MNGTIAPMKNEAALIQAPAIADDLYSRFISFIDAKPRTVETYTKALKQFIRWLSLNGITQPGRADVLAYRDTLKQKHKPSTVQNYITVVRLFFQWTEQEGLYKNIAAHIKGAKLDSEHKKDPLTSGQVKNVINSINRNDAQGLRDYAIFTLMISVGLRTIEVARANIEDFRPIGDSMRLFIQGKGHDEKTDVEIAEPVERAIRAYLKATGNPSAGPLFRSTAHRNSGARMTTRSISGIVKARLRNAGLDNERLTAHSLRHTCATQSRLNGVSLEETQKLLRHSKITTTQIYDHALEKINNHAAAVVAEALFAGA